MLSTKNSISNEENNLQSSDANRRPGSDSLSEHSSKQKKTNLETNSSYDHTDNSKLLDVGNIKNYLNNALNEVILLKSTVKAFGKRKRNVKDTTVSEEIEDTVSSSQKQPDTIEIDSCDVDKTDISTKSQEHSTNNVRESECSHDSTECVTNEVTPVKKKKKHQRNNLPVPDIFKSLPSGATYIDSAIELLEKWPIGSDSVSDDSDDDTLGIPYLDKPKAFILLPPKATCQKVTKLLQEAQVQEIIDVLIISHDNFSKAYVTFGDEQNYQKALALNKKIAMSGQTIAIKPHKDDNPWVRKAMERKKNKENA